MIQSSLFLALPIDPQGGHDYGRGLGRRWLAQLLDSLGCGCRGTECRRPGGCVDGGAGGARRSVRARRCWPQRGGSRSGSCCDLGARALLGGSGVADRAGLWLSGDRRGESGAGCVVEAEAGSDPGTVEAAGRFDAVPAGRARKPGAACAWSFRRSEGTPHLGPPDRNAQRDLDSAAGERAGHLDWAMVGYARPPGEVDIDALRARADEIALAVQHDRNFRHGEQAAEEKQGHSCGSRARFCAAFRRTTLLRQIARTARHYAPAAFRGSRYGARASPGRGRMGRGARVAGGPASRKPFAPLANCFQGRAGIGNSGRSGREFFFRLFDGFSLPGLGPRRSPPNRRAKRDARRSDGGAFRKAGRFRGGFSKAGILRAAGRVGAGSRSRAGGADGVHRDPAKNH
jgi:hypothetical protein